MGDLLSVDNALVQVLERFQPLPAETIHLTEALDRVLTEDIIADVNLPPFANSSMDGFAVRAADTTSASQNQAVQLRVVMDIPAGNVPPRALLAGEAARIMTGAPIPEGADAVIPVENTDVTWTPGAKTPLPASVNIYRSVKSGDYVRLAGEDICVGQLVLEAGSVLSAAEIGVLAALGQAYVAVARRPRVAILSTGDELVDISEPVREGQIRNSNSYTLAALVTVNGGISIRVPTARDSLDDVRRCFREALEAKPDLILSSAGVSVGAFDVVRQVIEELGHIDFWRINLRPGKPLAFGDLHGVPFFGLPGNPVSAMVTFEVFVRPALLKLGHRPDTTPIVNALLAEDLRSDGRRSYLRVKLHRENGQYIAHLTGTQSSGALMSMVLADGLLIVPEGVTHAATGTSLPVRLLRQLAL